MNQLSGVSVSGVSIAVETGTNADTYLMGVAVAASCAVLDQSQTVAAALFSDFPGNNGETIEIEVP